MLGDGFAMRSIKADALDFNEALTVAINSCFEQDTDDLDNEKWDELIAEQGITDCTVIDVNNDDVDEWRLGKRRRTTQAVLL